MYKFINKDKIEISTGGNVRTELEKLIQDIGLGYTDLLLDNLKILGEHGFNEAETLFNKLMELRDKECTLRLDIESPQQLVKEINSIYWINFQFLYGYRSIVNYIIYNGDIVVINEEEALNILFDYYKNNPQEVANKLSWLAKNEKELYELNKATRQKIIKDTKTNKNSMVDNTTEVRSSEQEFELHNLK